MVVHARGVPLLTKHFGVGKESRARSRYQPTPSMSFFLLLLPSRRFALIDWLVSMSAKGCPWSKDL